jgi:undecaprenyl-diphosphatase
MLNLTVFELAGFELAGAIGSVAMDAPLLAVAEVNGLALAVQALVLGVVQGITEFLPISSTAHLIIFRDILGWSAVSCLDDAGALVAGCVARPGWSKAAIDALQFGSVIAVVIYFWKDLVHIFGGAWRAFQAKDWNQPDWKMFLGIAIGTIPALLGAILLKALKVELESPMLIAIMSLIMATLLGLAEKMGRRERSFGDIEVKDGILVGLGQTIALLPGASRSGSTLTTGLFLGLTRETAARFSFLLGLPTLTIATLVQAKDVLKESGMALPLLVAIASTFVFSYLSISWLLKFLQNQTNWIFVWYRLGFAALLFAAIVGGKL